MEDGRLEAKTRVTATDASARNGKYRARDACGAVAALPFPSRVESRLSLYVFC